MHREHLKLRNLRRKRERRPLLERQRVVAHDPRTLLNQELCAIESWAGRVCTGIERIIGVEVLPPPGANEDRIARLQLDTLMPRRLSQVVGGDLERGG